VARELDLLLDLVDVVLEAVHALLVLLDPALDLCDLLGVERGL
jgi:hypothetical protein